MVHRVIVLLARGAGLAAGDPRRGAGAQEPGGADGQGLARYSGGGAAGPDRDTAGKRASGYLDAGRLDQSGASGDRKRFQSVFRTPIEKQGDAGAQARLNRRLRPFLLRRTKAEVAACATDALRDGAQRSGYETSRVRTGLDSLRNRIIHQPCHAPDAWVGTGPRRPVQPVESAWVMYRVGIDRLVPVRPDPAATARWPGRPQAGRW